MLVLTRPQYEAFKIKEYDYWTLYLHAGQFPHVGRCYAWYKDGYPGEGEGLDISDIPPQVLDELLYKVRPAVKAALFLLGYEQNKRGEPAKFLLNTCYLSNEEAHHNQLHVHFIPRSRNPITIKQVNAQSTDPNWGKNYSQTFQTTAQLEEQEAIFTNSAVIRMIRRTMIGALGGIQ